MSVRIANRNLSFKPKPKAKQSQDQPSRILSTPLSTPLPLPDGSSVEHIPPGLIDFVNLSQINNPLQEESSHPSPAPSPNTRLVTPEPVIQRLPSPEPTFVSPTADAAAVSSPSPPRTERDVEHHPPEDVASSRHPLPVQEQSPLFRDSSPEQDEDSLEAAREMLPPPAKKRKMATTKSKPKPNLKAKEKIAWSSTRKLGSQRTTAERKQLQFDSDDSGFEEDEPLRKKAKKAAASKLKRHRLPSPVQASETNDADNHTDRSPQPRNAEQTPRKRFVPRRRISDAAPPPAETSLDLTVQRQPVIDSIPSRDEETAQPDDDLADLTPKPKKRRKVAQTSLLVDDDGRIDTTVSLMGDLCADVESGRLSAAGEALAEARSARKLEMKEKRARMRALAKLRRAAEAAGEDGSDNDNAAGLAESRLAAETADPADLLLALEQARESTALPVAEHPSPALGPELAVIPEEPGVDETEGDEEATYNETQYVARSRIVNGRLVVDEESMQVMRREPSVLGDILEEQPGSRRITSATYGKRQHSARWTADENDRFYEAIRCNGLDLTLISMYMGTRSRKQVKAKLKREEQLNEHLITKALQTPEARGDLASFGLTIGLDLEGPCPEDPLEAFLREKETRPVVKQAPVARSEPASQAAQPIRSRVKQLKQGKNFSERMDGVISEVVEDDE